MEYATYPFLGVSLLLWVGMGFGAAFVTDFTVENRSDLPVVVTPIGAVGAAGHRVPLPTRLFRFPPLPSWQRGGYRLRSGESVTIRYDMDDINISEIVVATDVGPRRQLVVDPNPSANRYHGPVQQRYVIENVEGLEPVTAPVLEAANAAQRQGNGAMVMYSLLIAPWLAYAAVFSARFVCMRRQRNNQPVMIPSESERSDRRSPQ